MDDKELAKTLNVFEYHIKHNEDGSIDLTTHGSGMWVPKRTLNEIPIQIDTVFGSVNIEFNIPMKNFPRIIKGDCFIQFIKEYTQTPKVIKGEVVLMTALPPSAYIPWLFVDVMQVTFRGSSKRILAVEKILNSGRIGGKMPRELIPTKINELRDMDAEYNQSVEKVRKRMTGR
jgi:hypothetical protein